MFVKAYMAERPEGGWRITLRLVINVGVGQVESLNRQVYKDYQYLDREAVNMKAGAVAAKVQFSPDPDLYFDYLCGMGWSPYLPEGGDSQPND